MKTIIVTLEIDVPDEATDKDITDFVDVEYGQCNSMKMDNPCRAAMHGASISNSADFAIDEVSQVTAPVSTVVPDDYFASLVSKARPAAEKAMRKFPQPNYVLLKVAEEAGEVVQAGVHYAEGRMSWEQVEGEIVQLLAMLIRLVTEGDQINGVTPPAHTRAAMLQSFGNSEQLPEPVADVVAWRKEGEERTCDIRWRRFDVAPGPLFTRPLPPGVPDGYCIMPLKLTAANGAKAALSGEFHVNHHIVCGECAGEGCESCNEAGGWEGEILIGWDTIKRIHEAAVEACALPESDNIG